jgi:hypothetical protein
MGALLSALRALLGGEQHAKMVRVAVDPAASRAHRGALGKNSFAWTTQVIVGLGGAGKTTILSRLKLGTTVDTIPTIGSNVETIVRNRLRM